MGLTLNMQVIQQSQSIGNNTSDVYVNISISSTGGYNRNQKSGKFVLDGKEYNFSHSFENGTKDNPKTTELYSGTHTVKHNDDGGKRISYSATFTTGVNPATVSCSGELVLTTIPRASSVFCTDAMIGSTAMITISRYSSAFTHTLTYSFCDISGTIVTKTANTSVPWTIPEKFYSALPDRRGTWGTIICDTYNGNTKIGTSTTRFNTTVNETECAPEITFEIYDVNEKSVNLTGQNTIVVENLSDVYIHISAVAKHGATISAYLADWGRGKTTSDFEIDDTGAHATLICFTGNYILVKVTDSRGISSNRMRVLSTRNYFPPTINADAHRLSQTSDTICADIVGKSFKGSFGKTQNSRRVFYQIKRASEQDFGEAYEIPVGDTEEFSVMDVVLGQELSYEQAYNIRFTIEDAVQCATYNTTVIQGIPIFDFSDVDFNFNVPVLIHNIPMQDFVMESGCYGEWQYQKWNSGRIQLWTDSIEHTVQFTSVGNLYYCGFHVNVPIVKRIICVTGGVTHWRYVNWTSVTKSMENTTPTQIDFRYYGANNNGNNSTIQFSAHVIGEWK